MKPTPTAQRPPADDRSRPPRAGLEPDVSSASTRPHRPTATDPELDLLLTEPFAAAWSHTRPDRAAAQALRQRLVSRTQASHRAEAGLVTVRRRRARPDTVAAGVTRQTLYRAADSGALRPGEPLASSLIELAAGARLTLGAVHGAVQAQSLHRECLVLSGQVVLDGDQLGTHDFCGMAGDQGVTIEAGDDGAWLFVRESMRAGGPQASSCTVRDADAGWCDFAPGIQRRVLWQLGGQAALLYRAQPGASVPLHTHGHDEECLMLQGELFLDDQLLQRGDYQLAPAGSRHGITETDVGALIYAHGDLDLAFVG